MEPLNAAYNMDAGDDGIEAGCESWHKFRRRRFLYSSAMATGGLLSQGMLTRVAERLSMASDIQSSDTRSSDKLNAKSLIILWMQGGPSQLETFDPHSGSKIGALPQN